MLQRTQPDSGLPSAYQDAEGDDRQGDSQPCHGRLPRQHLAQQRHEHNYLQTLIQDEQRGCGQPLLRTLPMTVTESHTLRLPSVDRHCEACLAAFLRCISRCTPAMLRVLKRQASSLADCRRVNATKACKHERGPLNKVYDGAKRAKPKSTMFH